MGKSSGPKSVSTLTNQQQVLSNLLMEQLAPGILGGEKSSQAQGVLQNSLIGKGATPYHGQIIPNLMSQYQQALGMIQQYNPNQYNQQTNQALNSALSGASAYNASPTLNKNYLNNAILNPMLNEFDKKIAPRIRQGFAGVGAFSSREGNALGSALGDLSVNAQQQFAQANFQQRQFAESINAQAAESARNRQLQAIGLAGQQSILPLQQAGAITSALNPFQQRADSQAQAQYSEFQRTAPENNPWIQQALGLIGQQQKALYNAPSPISQAIGNIGGLLSLGMLGGSSFGGLFGGGANQTMRYTTGLGTPA